MNFKLGFLFGFIGLCYTHPSDNPRTSGNEFCAILGTYSNVICISKTEFLLSFQVPSDTPIRCPSGMVCTNAPEVCKSETIAEPACRNIGVGGGGCQSCRSDATADEPVCVSQAEYSFCIGGKVSTAYRFSCRPPTPYCRVTFEGAETKSICTCNAVSADCPAA